MPRTTPTPDRADVVVVGAGSAGCVVAARLAEESERTVLLLEAGPVFADEASYPEVLRDERTFPQDHLWRYDGLHHEDPGTLATPIARGRVLGGSGAVNGMIWQRGLPEDYDAWGLPGWSAADLAPVLDRIERDLDHGDTAGRVPVRRLGREHWSPAHAAFHDALRDLGAPANPDLLRPEHQGVGPFARNSDGGRRMGAALAYLLPATTHPNLTVQGDVQVVRVVAERGRAVGVVVREHDRERLVGAGQVVLCAGAIETPQLLVHSGVGAADEVRALGLDVVADLPGVGRGLHDHPSVVSTVRLRDEVRAWDLRCLVGLVRTSSRAAAAGRRSDLQTLVMSGPWVGNNGGALPHAADQETVDVVQNPILYAPESRGRVEVLGADPDVRPRIRYRYLETDADRERLREAVRLTAEVWAAPAFAELIADDAGAAPPDALEDDDRLDAWIRANLQSTLHGCGTCRMGTADDPGAVVDHDCRVRGVDGLWIADLSVVPTAPCAATNATAMVVGEQVADRL